MKHILTSKNFMRITILFFLLGCYSVAISQSSYNLTLDDLINLQKVPLVKAKDFFAKSGWDFHSSSNKQWNDYFGYDLGYSTVGWAYEENYGKAYGWAYLMQREGNQNIFIYQTLKENFNNLEKEAKNRFSQSKAKIPDENELSTAYKSNKGLSLWFSIRKESETTYYTITVLNEDDFDILIKQLVSEYEYSMKEGDFAFENKEYEVALFNYKKAFEINSDKDLEEKISQTENLLTETRTSYNDNLSKADIAYKNKDFKQAKIYYKNAYENIKTDYALSQIKFIELLEEDYKNYIITADSLFNNNHFDLAIKNYEAALKLINETYPKDKILEAKNINNFLVERRKTIYEYSDYNKTHWNTINSSINQDIKSFLSKDEMIFKGNITYTYTIDTLGKTNYNFSSGENTADITISNGLKNIGTKYHLEPIYKYGFLLNSKGSLQMDLSFDKTRIYKVVKRDRLIIKNDKETPYLSEINNLLSNTPKGKFKVQIHQQKINNNDFSDNKIIGYNHIGGPSNAFLSLIVPGLGNKSVSSNRSGLSIALITYGLIGAGIGSKFYSISEYDKYHKATIQSDMDKYYNNANYANYAFYGLVATGVSIWMYDIFKVAQVGFKNRKAGKIYRSQIGLAYNPEFNSFNFAYSIKY